MPQDPLGPLSMTASTILLEQFCPGGDRIRCVRHGIDAKPCSFRYFSLPTAVTHFDRDREGGKDGEENQCSEIESADHSPPPQF